MPSGRQCQGCVAMPWVLGSLLFCIVCQDLSTLTKTLRSSSGSMSVEHRVGGELDLPSATGYVMTWPSSCPDSSSVSPAPPSEWSNRTGNAAGPCNVAMPDPLPAAGYGLPLQGANVPVAQGWRWSCLSQPAAHPWRHVGSSPPIQVTVSRALGMTPEKKPQSPSPALRRADRP